MASNHHYLRKLGKFIWARQRQMLHTTTPYAHNVWSDANRERLHRPKERPLSSPLPPSVPPLDLSVVPVTTPWSMLETNTWGPFILSHTAFTTSLTVNYRCSFLRVCLYPSHRHAVPHQITIAGGQERRVQKEGLLLTSFLAQIQLNQCRVRNVEL